MATSNTRHANVVGLGLIGGSLCLALLREGYIVHGIDADSSRQSTALDRGVITDSVLHADAEIGFVATPVARASDAICDLLGRMSGFVTDVCSTKEHVALSVADGRFVPGHPMAGSELDGLDGADGSMFEGAVWVLTPTPDTRDDAFEFVAALVARIGADVVTLSPRQHDRLVATISHVPHLTAATLMSLADDRSEEHLALLRLAAGGFRDMTRIASGRPEIWIDICEQNRDAIVEALGSLVERLEEVRNLVADGRDADLLRHLERARRARMNLPAKIAPSAELAEVRIPIPDRPGAAADVFALAAELGVNVFDFEVVHSVEGDRGVLIAVIDVPQVELFRGGLLARGFRPAVQRIS